ncbi:hypothetical protein FRC11_014668 [Ceratobasidium sp. 423]|nr:hypothetical protein FRC11_014668 [Ceratobasidium sp. 423]
MLVHDPDIDMNKAITNNDPEVICKICYQDEEAAAQGEVIVWRKAKSPNMARGRAKVKELKNAKQTQEPNAGDNLSTSIRHGVPSGSQAEAQSEVSGEGNQQVTNNNANNSSPSANTDANADVMDMSFHAVALPKTLVDMNEDEVGDLTHDMISMSIDHPKDDNAEGGMEEILGPVNPHAMSTLLSMRITQQAPGLSMAPHGSLSAMSNTIHATSTTPASAPVTSSKPKVALANSMPDAAILTLPPATPSPLIALMPPSAPSPTQSLTQGATTTTGVHIPPADLASLLPANLASHITKICLLAASLGDAQHAAMPPELLQSLAMFAMLTPRSAPAQPPTPKSGIDDALFGGDSDLSGPESTSESNPPITNQGPTSSSTQLQAQSCLKAKTAAKAKVVLPSADNGEAKSVSVKTVQVIRAAKGGKGMMAMDWSGGEPVTTSTKNTGT